MGDHAKLGRHAASAADRPSALSNPGYQLLKQSFSCKRSINTTVDNLIIV